MTPIRTSIAAEMSKVDADGRKSTGAGIVNDQKQNEADDYRAWHILHLGRRCQ